MATKPPVKVRVDNLREVQRAIRRAADDDLKRELRAANKAAAEIVADKAKVLVPERSGRLKGSIAAQAGQRDAKVKAGTASRVPYAGPIHFGWPARGIRPQPFLYEALDDRIRQVREAYAKALREVVQKVNRSTS